MKTRINAAMTTIMLAICVASSVHAGDVYTTGFESPTFALGPLGGQDGWASSGASIVQNTKVLTGAQAAQIFPGDIAQAPFWAGRSGLVEIAFDVMFTSAAATSRWDMPFFGVSLLAGGVFVEAGGAIKASPNVDSGLVIVRDDWTNFRILCDLSAQTYCVIVDGVEALRDVAMLGNITQLVGMQVKQTIGTPGTDTAYLDNAPQTHRQSNGGDVAKFATS